jgi:hypothetical protein
MHCPRSLRHNHIGPKIHRLSGLVEVGDLMISTARPAEQFRQKAWNRRRAASPPSAELRVGCGGVRSSAICSRRVLLFGRRMCSEVVQVSADGCGGDVGFLCVVGADAD